MPEYLFDYNREIFETIDKTDEVLLFLDYDGTLVYFKDQPHEVDTPYEVKTVLKMLIQNHKFTVFIVSGRPLHEIKNLIDIEGVSFAALHGLHMECSDGRKLYLVINESRIKIRRKNSCYEIVDLKGLKLKY